MSFVNHVAKSLAIKIVYYGAGLSGKTTNLRYINGKLDRNARGDLICLETDTERTYFFDLLPVKAGLIGDYIVHFQLMTVPGQIFYEASRKNVLRGADGVIFVADSQIPLLDANLESFDNLRRNLLALDMDINEIPLVFQYNKRDLDDLIPVETFNRLLNPGNRPFVEAAAIKGTGVFETLKEIAKLAVPLVREKVFGPKLEPADRLDDETKVSAAVGGAEKKEPEAGHGRGPEDEAHMRRMKLRTLDEIETELDKLSREFLSRGKKQRPS